jgi:hypothetical protein
MNTVITFDLHDADSEKSEKAHEILATLGFVRTVPSTSGGRVPLPETTAVGDRTEGAQQIRDWVWSQFGTARTNSKRVFVAKYDGAAWQAVG